MWYVEPCGGEGEYHVSRMRSEIDERPPMKWPKVEETRGMKHRFLMISLRTLIENIEII